jgi:hypothetical protein
MDKPYFKVRTPLGVEVRTTATYWGEIVTFKHPVMRGKEDSVKAALANPLEIRRSQKDPTVHIYYGAAPPYYICVFVKHVNKEGFIITTYRTDVIKEGERLWPD